MFKTICDLRRMASRALPILPSLCLAAVLLSGCGTGEKDAAKTAAPAEEHGHDHDSEAGHSHDDGHDHGDETPAAGGAGEPIPGTVPIPALVRQNLGISFATVEMRRVESTVRLPGRFEPQPSAVREYHAPLAGRVELLVRQYDRVTTGMPLYRLDSSEWRRMQQELLTVEAEVMASSASLMTAKVAREGGEAAGDVISLRIRTSDSHISTLEQSLKLAEEREKQVVRLQQLVGGRLTELNEARQQIATIKNELSQAKEDRAELEHEHLQLSTAGSDSAYGTTETRRASLLAREAEHASALARRDLLKASLLAIQNDQATETQGDDILWKSSPLITVVAATEGVVSEIQVTSGGYVDSAAAVLTTVNTNHLRFRATALQSDIQRLNQSMPGRILRPGGAVGTEGDFIPVTVTLGFEADPEERTLDLVADVESEYAWARSGLSTDIELVLDDTEDPETAIPVGAVIQDGLDKVFFRRSPENPDVAIRVKADLGLSDGRWVVVYSGVKAGDEVVLNGVYELKLATADAPKKAGHFHADGTFHDEEH